MKIRGRRSAHFALHAALSVGCVSLLACGNSQPSSSVPLTILSETPCAEATGTPPKSGSLTPSGSPSGSPSASSSASPSGSSFVSATASASVPLSRAPAPMASASSGRPSYIPNWTVTGSDPARGAMTLRCENAFPPDDHSGKCACEGLDLQLCVDGTKQLGVDRKECDFICKPTLESAKKVALACPDRSLPSAGATGCGCAGRLPLDPCKGGLASAVVEAGRCVVTCKKAQ